MGGKEDRWGRRGDREHPNIMGLQVGRWEAASETRGLAALHCRYEGP